ncbi:MAG: HEPN domain-containing protein [Candidatus Electryonea clarkiae]|nr:HEPN domain-containing protein [Candidatus Electryonea clarkiae]MDP8287029.1 HEPN domain-containing protein [Candidatus Electryonea clarkiae]
MTHLEAKFSALLVDCEKLLKPFIITAQKWIAISKSEKVLQTIVNESASLSHSYGHALQSISNLNSYKESRSVFENDKVFIEAKSKAGYWVTFDAVLQYIIINIGRIQKNGVKLNTIEAISLLRAFRKNLTSRHIQYDASVRLLGVNIRSKTLDLPDGITLYRLNRKERNKKQPILELSRGSGWGNQVMSDHPVELRVKINIPVDHTQENAFFRVQENAMRVASEIFAKVLQAILIVKGGKVKLNEFELKGGLEQLPVAKSLISEVPPIINIILGKADMKNIYTAYNLISSEGKGDNTLFRSLQRFILGLQRSSFEDRLIDFIVAWESILLTQGGDSIAQELSYRFALNGATIIHSIKIGDNRQANFKKMKSAYFTRSSLVHGSEKKTRDKHLQKGGFKNLHELCEFLESNFREMIFWLASMKPNNRPYRKQDGWESLIWPTK